MSEDKKPEDDYPLAYLTMVCLGLFMLGLLIYTVVLTMQPHLENYLDAHSERSKPAWQVW